MGSEARETLARVLAIAVVGVAAVLRTMGTTSQLVVGLLLASALIGFALILWRSRVSGMADRRTGSRERRVAIIGALLALLVLTYSALFDSMATGSRIAAGAVLTLGTFAYAGWWAGWKGVAGAALAAAVVAYGVLFEEIGGTPQAIIGALLGILIVAGARTLWRSWAVAIGASLAYAIVVYRLSFESIADVSLRTLIAAVLLLAVIFIALRWWLFWQRPRARWAAAVVSFLSLALVAFTLVRGVELLGAKQPPRERAEAPAVGFVSPHPAKPGRGFALGLGIEVESCDEPVHATLVAAGTAEYWRDNPRGGFFKLGIPGSELTLTDYGVSWGSLTVTNAMDAVPKEREGWGDEDVQNMTTVFGRLPAPQEVEPYLVTPSIVVKFDAIAFDDERKWLEDRGQGTCYVRLPALSGNFTAFAAEQADGHAYRPRAFPIRRLLRRSGECVPQVSERTFKGHRLQALYCPAAEIVHGNAAVRATSEGEGEGAGEVLADDSIPEPDTVVEGDPVWSCVSDPRGEHGSAKRELAEAGAGFAFSTDRLEREIASNCSGFVAVSEADADERRDVTLILIGIGVALGLGAFVELLMRWIDAEFPLKHRDSPGGPTPGT